MHAMVAFTYDGSNIIKKMGHSEYELFYNEFPELNEHLPKPDAEKNPQVGFWSYSSVMIDLTDTGARLVEKGIAFEVKRFKSTYKVTSPEEFGKKAVNIQIAIPNMLLFAVDEVLLLEDVCTDRLQEHLDDGWRILSVCPPAAQRRPDYILGRTKPIMQ